MSPSVSIRLLLTQSDARLVALAGVGHERAFEALVQRYRRPLLHYCRRLLLPDARAEDALQQALLQAWLALQRGVEVTDARAWLYRIVHNAALNMLRVSGYDYCELNESLSGADAPQADLDRRIAVREALAGLAALPDMQREALLRTAIEGRSHHQVAMDLGLSDGALRGLVYRARATLRAAATAITPPPVLNWTLGHAGGGGVPFAERLAEVGAGGGSVGLGGLLLKGGAVAVTASALAGAVVTAHHHAHAKSELARAAGGAPSALGGADAGRSYALVSSQSPPATPPGAGPGAGHGRRASANAGGPWSSVAHGRRTHDLQATGGARGEGVAERDEHANRPSAGDRGSSAPRNGDRESSRSGDESGGSTLTGSSNDTKLGPGSSDARSSSDESASKLGSTGTGSDSGSGSSTGVEPDSGSHTSGAGSGDAPSTTQASGGQALVSEPTTGDGSAEPSLK